MPEQFLAAIEEFGFDEKFQTVYLDSENEILTPRESKKQKRR